MGIIGDCMLEMDETLVWRCGTGEFECSDADLERCMN